ncbi:MAG: TonB family protein [Nitrospinae bacterium]|nr:TonB family protein [Nitrospinota bacterium]
MISHRIKVKEIDSPVEMGRSFVFSLVFHILIIGGLFFSPAIFPIKKKIYIPAYKVTLVELPKKQNIALNQVQGIVEVPMEPVIPPHIVEPEPIMPPEPAAQEQKKIEAPPLKKIEKKTRLQVAKPTKEKRVEAEAVPAAEPAKVAKIAETPEGIAPPLSKEKEVLSPPAQKTDVIATDIDFPYQLYLSAITNKINNNWTPPVVDLLSGDIKKVVIKFKILKDGRIEGAEIENRSGFPLFDDSALRAVLSSRLPPLPKGFGENYLGIHFGFEYEKKG